MGTITRDLLPFAVGRNAGETVDLLVLSPTPLADGSFSVVGSESDQAARVVNLSPSEIQRLREGGITISEGVSVSFVGEPVKIPDSVILASGVRVKVKHYTRSEGATVLICSVPALGADEEEESSS